MRSTLAETYSELPVYKPVYADAFIDGRPVEKSVENNGFNRRTSETAVATSSQLYTNSFFTDLDQTCYTYWDEGYLVIPDFTDEATMETMRTECYRLVQEMVPSEHNTVFKSNKFHLKVSDDYFMTSGDKIRYFFEDGARDNEDNLILDKHRSLNKIGHALANLSEPFKKFTFSEKIQGIARRLGMADPALLQSMYIFKQPGIGGQVCPHQDSTFLYTNPMKLVGFWLALEDATLDNGCLWFIPRSHKNGLLGNRRCIRTPNKQKEDNGLIYTGDLITLDQGKLIAGPVKKGTMILIHGEVQHKSEKNLSEKSRHAYTFHLYDQKDTVYSQQNCVIELSNVSLTFENIREHFVQLLQPTKETRFPRLYTTPLAQ